MKHLRFFDKFNLNDRISLKQFKEFEKRYQAFSELPVVSTAFIANNKQMNTMNTVHIIKSQKNMRHEMTRNLLETYVESNDEYKCIPWTFNINSTSIYPSPSRNRIAIINKINHHKDKNSKISVIEIYENQQLIDTIYPSSDSFGEIHQIEPFCGVSWNQNENLIAFIAEKHHQKSTNFFNETKPSTTDISVGQNYEFYETFGEQMNAAQSTTLFIYDLDKKQLYDLNEIDNIIPTNIALGECLFDPNDSSSIIVIAYNTYPRRLGLRFYNTRPTELWLIKLPSHIVSNSNMEKAKIINLAPNEHSPHSVRFSPNGNVLTYLCTNDTLSHLATTRLQSMEWPPVPPHNKVNIETIIDIPTNITSKDVIENNIFGGIFAYNGIPTRCWIDDETMILNSLYRHKYTILFVNIKNKCIQRLDECTEIIDNFNDLKNEICRDLTVLDCDMESKNILFTASSIQRGHTTHIYNYNTKKVYNLTKTIDFDNNKTVKNDLIRSMCDIETKVINIKCDDNENEIFESILYIPPKEMTEFDNDPIILLYIHGGPHSANTLCFSNTLLTLLYSGFAILQVNYRGSIGISESFINCLHGNIGDLDVRDCINALDFVCQNAEQLLNIKDPNKLKKIVFGGSHGGFLTAHLIAKYPKVFKCAVSANPALNLLSMFGLSDIPDWILYECGIKTKYNDDYLMKPLNRKEIEIINNKSPHNYIDDVITPYQILCGAKDQRVPMHQAIEYYKMLKAKNGTQNARLLIYPHCQHGLNDIIEEESDVWGNIWAWFRYHCST